MNIEASRQELQEELDKYVDLLNEVDSIIQQTGSGLKYIIERDDINGEFNFKAPDKIEFLITEKQYKEKPTKYSVSFFADNGRPNILVGKKDLDEALYDAVKYVKDERQELEQLLKPREEV